MCSRGRTLVALLLAVSLLGSLLPAAARTTATIAAPGFADAIAAPAGDGPSDLPYHRLARKKLRRTQLAPATATPDPQAAPVLKLPARVARAPSASASGGHPVRVEIDPDRRGPALPAAPQLRLRPGQAPPAP